MPPSLPCTLIYKCAHYNCLHDCQAKLITLQPCTFAVFSGCSFWVHSPLPEFIFNLHQVCRTKPWPPTLISGGSQEGNQGKFQPRERHVPSEASACRQMPVHNLAAPRNLDGRLRGCSDPGAALKAITD